MKSKKPTKVSEETTYIDTACKLAEVDVVSQLLKINRTLDTQLIEKDKLMLLLREEYVKEAAALDYSRLVTDFCKIVKEFELSLLKTAADFTEFLKTQRTDIPVKRGWWNWRA